MTMSKAMNIVLLTLFAGFVGLLAADRLTTPGSFGVISTAQARIGRPVTPVSVGGVARRSVRRCAVGVYRC